MAFNSSVAAAGGAASLFSVPSAGFSVAATCSFFSSPAG